MHSRSVGRLVERSVKLSATRAAVQKNVHGATVDFFVTVAIICMCMCRKIWRLFRFNGSVEHLIKAIDSRGATLTRFVFVSITSIFNSVGALSGDFSYSSMRRGLHHCADVCMSSITVIFTGRSI